MRFSRILGTEADAGNEAVGVTIDVLTGIVAGFALVLAILILSSSLNYANVEHAPLPHVAEMTAGTSDLC
jgi:hypothetical protein